MMMSSDPEPLELQLSELRWEKRVLLIFTDDASDERYKQQLEMLEEAEAGLNDRKLVRITLAEGEPAKYEGRPLTEESARQIRARFAPDENRFSFVLLGLDGGEKLRSETPVSMDDLFARIDRMPMRARELRNRN
ncbi:MAG: DUF4174 domain-containing protein [Cyclonatronaceae bacterium]